MQAHARIRTHTCAGAREETSSTSGIQHRAHADVTGVATMPESSEAEFAKLI